MLKKRLIGVVTVKNGWAVQSFGYRRYLPLGKPECLVENLDRWGADEILVQVIDRSEKGNGPDFELLRKLAQLGLGTPLIYCGGIRNVDDGVEVIQSGADRFAVDSLLRENLSAVTGLGQRLGAQAVIASLPMTMGGDGPQWLNYRTRTSSALSQSLKKVLGQGVISEVLLTDYRHEGLPQGFDVKLLEQFPVKDIPVIAFGGISHGDQMRKIFSYSSVSAISVGNFLNYREHAVQKYKTELASAALRPSFYASDFPL